MLKTIATCRPSEFLKQTNRLRKAAEKWLKDTGIPEIRRQLPELEEVPEDAAEDIREEIAERNSEALRKQAQKNFSQMLEAALEKYPDETLEVLALCCFVEPENVDDHEIGEYIEAVNSIIANRTVWSFFISLLRPAQTSGSRPQRQ